MLSFMAALMGLAPILVSAPLASAPSVPGLAAALRRITDTAAAKYNNSISLSVRAPTLFIEVASGVVDGKGTPAQPSDPYAWGSITKTFTGAAILKHVAAGRLSLDEPAAPHVDAMLKTAGYPYETASLFRSDRWAVPPVIEYDANAITIRHLLHMVSGVKDYDTDAYRHLQYSHAAVDYGPLDLLDIVHTPLMFAPGGPVPSRGHHGWNTTMNCGNSLDPNLPPPYLTLTNPEPNPKTLGP